MAKKITKTQTPLSNKPISTKELKFWLAGVLEMQSPDWVPNSEQWNNIKNKIFNLEDNVITLNAPQVMPHMGINPSLQQGGVSGSPEGMFQASPGFETQLPALPRVNEKGFLMPPTANPNDSGYDPLKYV